MGVTFEMKVSIVVPVYNVENYLKRCIESIINQTYQKIEIILVNDGSTDSSPEICNEFARMDNRIRVIHQKNVGLSGARNTGINEATGNYIYFIDSDDYVKNNTIESLISLAREKKCDVVIGNGLRITGDNSNPIKKEFKKSDFDLMHGIDYLVKAIQRDTYIACAWLNLYSLELIKKNQLYFKTGILHEDEEWTPRVLLHAKRVSVSDEYNYMYVIRENSITTKGNRRKNAIDIIETCVDLEKLFSVIKDKSQRKILNSHLANIYMGAVFMGDLDKEDKDKIDKKFPLNKTINMTETLKGLLFFVSPSLFCKINGFSKGMKF